MSSTWRSDPRHFATREIVALALEQYGAGDQPDVQLIGDSENLTFKVQQRGKSAPFILRLYRQGYHNKERILSEFQWMKALRVEAGVATPTVLPSLDGSLCVEIGCEGAEGRRVAAFEMLSGDEPAEANLVDSFGRLGRVTATLHSHAISWTPPQDFTRQTWDVRTMLVADNPTWGRWQNGIGMTPELLTLLSQAEAIIIRRLECFGTERSRFGLIHADLRLANLLVDGDETKVIDFDDCGFSWFYYDLGAALTFIEDHPASAAIIEAWLTGYRTVRPVPREEEEELETFRLLRRLVVVAWLGSHHQTATARQYGAGYLERAAVAAHTYLKQFA
jgi:Ser/Thr protein kinase RdoA (MazF antagonist)